MSPLTPYLALAIMPVACVLGFAFNPIEFTWAFKHGLKPKPEKVLSRAATVSRYANILGDALILSSISFLELKNSIPAERLGLHLHKWKTSFALGVAAGGLLIVTQGLMTQFISRNSLNPFPCHVRKGSVLLWVSIFIAGAFSEEIWIAFCLITLIATGHSNMISIAMTVIVFAAVHYGYRLFGVFAVALKCVISALLFLYSGSLIPMCLFHFIGNLGSLYWARTRRGENLAGQLPS